MSLFSKFDLELYIQKFQAQPTKKKDEWLLLCPICGKEKLCVNVFKKKWHCWVCQEYQVTSGGRRAAVRGAGNLVKLIQLLESCSLDRAFAIIKDQVGHIHENIRQIDGGVWSQVETVDDCLEFPAINPPPYWSPIKQLLPYMVKRGISMEDVSQFGLFHCTDGQYKNRLVFPAWQGSRMIYWQARAMWEAPNNPRFRKVLNPVNNVPGRAVPKKILMNLDSAIRYSRVAVVEGPMDCVHAGPSAVCTYGKALSSIQALLLHRRGVSGIDMLWDGPTEREPYGAWPEMIETGIQLSNLFDVRLVFLPYGDPGDYTREALTFYRSKGISVSKFFNFYRL